MSAPENKQPSKTPDAIKAAIAARLAQAGVHPIAEPNSTSGDRRADKAAPVSNISPMGKGINAEVRHTLDNEKAPAIPTHTIAAVVRAMDVVLPEQLEQRVLMIAGMYLNQVPAKEIAERLRIDEDLVKREIAKIDSARSVAYKDNKQLADKVVEQEYNVVAATVKNITQIDELADMLVEEMRCDFQDGQDARQNRTSEEFEEDPVTGKMKMKRPPSISPMKVDAFSKLLDVRGKQLDRLTDIFGLVKKHLPDDAKVGNTINILQVGADKLNSFADQFLLGTGNHIAPLNTPQPATTATVVDAEVVEKDEK